MTHAERSTIDTWVKKYIAAMAERKAREIADVLNRHYDKK